MSSFTLSLLILLTLAPSSLWAISTKIYIETGQSQTLEIPAGASLQLSQKKVLEVELIGKTQIRLVALRSGVVILRAILGDSERSWLIEVLSRDGQSDWLLRSEWQSFFCAKDGVHCDLENKIISGESNDLSWFYEAKQLCKKKMPCT